MPNAAPPKTNRPPFSRHQARAAIAMPPTADLDDLTSAVAFATRHHEQKGGGASKGSDPRQRPCDPLSHKKELRTSVR